MDRINKDSDSDSSTCSLAVTLSKQICREQVLVRFEEHYHRQLGVHWPSSVVRITDSQSRPRKFVPVPGKTSALVGTECHLAMSFQVVG